MHSTKSDKMKTQFINLQEK